MPLPPATRLGPYELLAMIGAGGMGEVYRARDTRLGREVAVKVLPEALSLDTDRLRRFEQEARAAGMLHHPNILVIYDIGTQNGLPYLVSELLHGETLRQRQKGTALGARKAIDYALQMARGLAAAHQRGLVHRDLKPDNLFLTNDGLLKILDFGLAKLMEPADPSEKTSAPTVAVATDPGVVMGTPGYMSPEQVRGQPTDHRTDIFSFGLILYELLSGQRAFQGSAPEAMTAILNNDPAELPEAVPPGVRQVVAHCLEKEPSKRFQSARDLSFALSALSQSSGASPIAAARPASTRKWLWLGAAAVLAIAAVGAWQLKRLAAPAAPQSVVTVTTYGGYQVDPSLSPDGSQVAFSWGGEKSDNYDIYVKMIGETNALRLTTDPA